MAQKVRRPRPQTSIQRNYGYEYEPDLVRCRQALRERMRLQAAKWTAIVTRGLGLRPGPARTAATATGGVMNGGPDDMTASAGPYR